MKQHKLYVPPSFTTIARLVNEVFDHHTQEDPIYTDPEIRLGLIQYLVIVASILAKHLSTAEEHAAWIDKPEK